MAMTYYYPRRKNTRRMNTYKPRMDVIENEEGYLVRVDVPGFTKEELTIDADHETLRIVAEKPEPTEEEKEDLNKVNYLHRERFSRKLSRIMSFPKPIDAAKASVKLENGVLEITLPIAEIAKSVKLVPK